MRFLPILFCLIGFSCKKDSTTLFQALSAKNSGISFKNNIQESEAENILSYEYFYNGGGIATGDFNNDGLQDIYFTGNQVDNSLYLNKGNLKFEDITKQAGVGGRKNGWKTGVCVVDINADGWLDLYVCYSGLRADSLRKNQLFINNQNLSFTDKAEEFGLADSGYSTQATFFDYDLDGDLDCFLINHNLGGYQRQEASVMRAARDYNAGDKLFRNDSKDNKYRFVDVSAEANIKGNPLGFGLGVSIFDANQDSFPDIYVTNDYVEDDYLYINQKDGTFKDELRERITHTSYSAMGIDIADINNDGLDDIYTLDMLPEENTRQKLLLWPDNWNIRQAQLNNGFWHENMRNMLQLNQGNGKFSEIGQLAGVSNTDWSWGTLLADFDGDGFKDIFVSNGMAKDYTNADFIKYFSEAEATRSGQSLLEHLKKMPTSKTKNYIFQNNHDLTFTNKQQEWGFSEYTISNGAIYADLDNDGDLEIITNNLNRTSVIYENTLQQTTPKNYIAIQLKGKQKNLNGLGAKIIVKDSKNQQTQEISLTHGFQSSQIDKKTFFVNDSVCQVTVQWLSGKIQTFQTSVNKIIEIDEKQALKATNTTTQKPRFLTENIPSTLNYKHQEPAINNFDRQIMLPMHYSYNGPKISTGDLNNDKETDLVVCGTELQPSAIIFQKKQKFNLYALEKQIQKNQDVIIADFNNDSFQDIYWVNGSYHQANYALQKDQLWLNDGKGNFTNRITTPDSLNNLVGKALDVDNDGDQDIFLGGHIKPNQYPYSEESTLLLNDGKGNFTRFSIGNLGIITSATVLDIDKDNYPDIIAVGEWSAPVLLSNKKGRLIKEENKSLNSLSGWWNQIESADLDNDGDADLVLGNLGLNSQIKASIKEPASLVFSDFDNNGSTDFFINYFIQGTSYPAHSRDEVIEQIPNLRRKFTDYDSFSTATIYDFFDESKLKKATKYQINELRTLILENTGKGKFKIHALPIEAQFSPVHSILLEDFDDNGKKDILLTGNNNKFRLRLGEIAANYGQLFLNKGRFIFEYVPQALSGLELHGNIRSSQKVGKTLFFGGNNQALQIYSLKQ